MRSRDGTLSAFLKSFLLGGVGLLVMLFSSSAPLFAAAVVIATGVGIFDLGRLITHSDKIIFSFTLAVSILLGYGMGSAIYLLNFWTMEPTKYQYWANEGLFFDQHGLGMALGVSMLAAAILYMWSSYEQPVYAFASFDARASVKARRLVWFGVFMVVIALLMGNIGYEGSVVSDVGHVSALGEILNLIVPPLVPFTLLLITAQQPSMKRLLLVAALVLFVGITLIQGRRYIIYVVVLSAAALNMRGYRVTKRSLVLGIVFSVFGGLLLYYGFNFFLALRIAKSELGTHVNLLEQLRAAFSLLESDRLSFVQEKLAENVGSRPFILSYLAGLMDINSARMPAFGGEFLYSVQTAVPSVLMPGKIASLPPFPEALIHPLYGIPIFDGPNSVIVAGFDDFGFLGALVYPLFNVLLFSAFYKAVRQVVRDQSIRLIVLFSLLFDLLYIEQAFGSVFVTLRNLIIVIAVAAIIVRIPVARLNIRRRYHRIAAGR